MARPPLSGTTGKTVKRVIARHESDGAPSARVPREYNYDAVTDLVAERVHRSKGRISAKRLLPAARAAGYEGSARNFRRLVAGQKALWRGIIIVVDGRRCATGRRSWLVKLGVVSARSLSAKRTNGPSSPGVAVFGLVATGPGRIPRCRCADHVGGFLE